MTKNIMKIWEDPGMDPGTLSSAVIVASPGSCRGLSRTHSPGF